MVVACAMDNLSCHFIYLDYIDKPMVTLAWGSKTFRKRKLICIDISSNVLLTVVLA